LSKPIEVTYKMVGLRIRQIRETLGLTQVELAKRVKMSRPALVNIELGRQRIMLHDIEIIAQAFGVTPKHLMRGIWT